MPIITVQFIKDVVANDEQKRELIQKMTDTFISVVGEVARPYTYCLIQETPQAEWGLAGKPLPDFQFLTSQEFIGMHARAADVMRGAIAQQQQQQSAAAPSTNGTVSAASLDAADLRAEAIWKGTGG